MDSGSRTRMLERALRAFMEQEKRQARNSYSLWDGRRRLFNEEIWQRADPEGYRLWATGRDLLRGERRRSA
jgi:hypothetical protein